MKLLNVEADIAGVLKEFSDAYKAKDLAKASALFAPGEETVMIGSAKGDMAIGFPQVKEALQREFRELEPLATDLQWASICGNENVAWVTTVVSTVDSRRQTATGRFTAVLAKREDQWLFLQFHFSFASGFGMAF